MFTEIEKYSGLTLKNRYRLERFLGEGISGLAFLAYDSLLEGWVVVKIIKDEIEGFPIALGEEWIEEPKKAMQVRSHPHIAAILDLGDEEARCGDEKTRVPFIVWEYIDGTLIEDFLKTGEGLRLPELLSLALQLLRTLQFLQVKKLAHGDLHSRNVMLLYLPGGGATIKLIDFGVARNVLTGKVRQDDLSGVLKILNQLLDKFLNSKPGMPETAAGFELRDQLRKAGNLLPSGKMTLQDLIKSIDQLEQRHCSTGDTGHSDSGKLSVSRRGRDTSESLPDFFGRRREMALLLESARKAFTHRLARNIFVLGETGSGKSLALKRVAAELNATGEAVVLDYSVNHADQQTRFSGLVGFWLKLVSRNRNRTRIESLLERFPHVWEHFSGKLPEMLSRFSGEQLRSKGASSTVELAEELRGLIYGAAKLIPVALIFDDLHAMDDETLRWLWGFKTGEPGVSLAAVYSFAPGEMDFIPHAEDIPLKSLPQDNPYVTIVNLQPLSSEDIEDLISSEFTFADHGDYSRFIEFLVSESGGEPFYVSEILENCIDEGFIGKDPSGHWEIRRDIEGFVMPRNVEAHVARRLMRINQVELSVIKCAAYFGQVFPAEGVRSVCGLEYEMFSIALESLSSRHHLFKRHDENRWTFVQPPIRKVLLKGIPFEEKRVGLTRITEWQIERAGQFKSPVFYLEISRNLFDLKRVKHGCCFAAAAAKGFLRAREYEHALDASGLVIARCTDIFPGKTGGIFRSIGHQARLEASMKLCRYDETLDSCEKLADIATETGDKDLALNASMRKALTLRLKCAYAAAEEQILNTIKLSKHLCRPRFEGEALRELGTVRYLKGEFEEAIEAFLQSAKVLDEIREVHAAAKTYNNLGLVYKQMGDYAPMEESFRLSVAKYREAGDKAGERLPLANLGLFHQQVGRFDEAKRCFEDILGQLESGENPLLEAKARLSLAQVQSSIGAIDDATRSAEAALLLFTDMNDKQGQSETMSILGDIALDQGQYNLAKEYHKRSLKLKEEIGSEMGICHSKLRLARVAINEGRFDIALELAKEVTVKAQTKGWTKLTIEGITETIRAVSEKNGPSAALEVLRENPTQDGTVGDPSMVLLDYYLAVAQTYLDNGLTTEASRHINAFEERYSLVLSSIKDIKVQKGFAEKMSRQAAIAAELHSRIEESESGADGDSD